MTLLPIADRELRVAARKSSTYWSRAGAALVTIAIGTWILLVARRSTPQSVGKEMFDVLTAIIFIYAAIAGIRATSDSLSEEKREGTLGLLFLTDLKGYDVVFGKLVAKSLGTFYGILAMLPVLAIPLLLGGVTYGQFWRVALTAVNTLLLSLAMGLFASAVCRDERKAVAFAVFLAVCFSGFFPLVGWIWGEMTNQRVEEAFAMLSAAAPCGLVYEPSLQRVFWTSTAVTHLYAWLLLALTCFIVPRSWQDKGNSNKPSRLGDKWMNFSQGTAQRRLGFRQALLQINPIYWLCARNRLKGKLVWGALFLGAIFWSWGWIEDGPRWLDIGNYVFTAICAHTVIKIWLGTEVSRQLIEDRRSGAIELLLSTPVAMKEIIRGQHLALLRQFGGPVAAMLLIDFIFMLAGLYEEQGSDFVVFWVSMCIAGMFMFVMDLFALSWLGIWTSVANDKWNRAAGSAVSRILFLPWLIFGVILTAIFVASEIPGVRPILRSINLPDASILYFWFILGVLNNLFWIRFSRRNLQRRFRELATRRFGAIAPGFRWITQLLKFLHGLYRRASGTPRGGTN